jgi:hypothetical protein
MNEPTLGAAQMNKSKIVFALAGALLTLAISSAPASASWIGNGTKLIGPVNGAFTTVIRAGGLNMECQLETGTWQLTKVNTKHEGGSLVVEIAKFSECALTAPEKLPVTVNGCSFEIGGETGVLKGLPVALLKTCVAKVASGSIKCEMSMTPAANKALKSLEVINKEANVEFLAGITNMTNELKGTCLGVEAVKGTGEVKIDNLIGEGLKAV